jgi:uncharacterized protein YyaL (SSP411 family)
MGQAYLELYNVTGERADLLAAEGAGRFIATHFAPAARGTGFVTSATATDAAYLPHPDRDENIALVRFATRLALASGDERFQAMGMEAMQYLAAASVATEPLSAGILLANEDATEAPMHITVVGQASDPSAIALHNASLRSIVSHELIEVRDPADRSPIPTKVTYPQLNRPALFLCTATACSSPVFDPSQVRGKIERAELRAR